MLTALLGLTLINANHKQISLALTHHLSPSSLTTQLSSSETSHVETVHKTPLRYTVCECKLDATWYTQVVHQNRQKHVRTIRIFPCSLNISMVRYHTSIKNNVQHCYITVSLNKSNIQCNSRCAAPHLRVRLCICVNAKLTAACIGASAREVFKQLRMGITLVYSRLC